MDEQLLIQFLTHTCTSEDLRLVDQWIASGKPNADWLFEMERIWSLKDELRFSDRREIEEAYNRFTLSQGKSKNAKPHFYIYPILKYVAAVIIIGLLGLNLYKMVQPATVGENTVEVPKGQRASLMLSDGTKIWLNSQSKLIYPTQFSDKERNVRLEGEAFFDVAHKEHLPFVVHSPLLAIKVLGTKFNVASYENDEQVTTTLAEGRVEVGDEKGSVRLKPEEQALFCKGDRSLRVVDVGMYLAWKDGKFIFEEQSLEQIMKQLQRWYEMSVFYTNEEVKQYTFSGDLKKYDDFDKIIRMLEEVSGIKISIKENCVVIGTK